MKILVFSDVHGSLNSLKALEQTADFATADKVIFLGDVAFGCSRPNECIELINKWNCKCILGNNDFYIIDHVSITDLLRFDETKVEQWKWMYKNILDKNKDILRKWDKSFELVVDGKKFYFTHYVWENKNNDISVVDEPTEINFSVRKQMFKGIEADYYIFGHEHKSSHVTDGDKHYCCVSSLGLKNNGPYIVIDIVDGQVKIEEKSVDFDIKQEIELLDKAGYPYPKRKINN